MAYVSSSAPLPQNSLMPPPADEVAASNARILANFEASRTGRERVYATLPTAAELWDVSSGLAVDANQRLGESEYARQSVLIGMGLPAELAGGSLAEIQANAPQIVSLNGDNSGGGLANTQNGTMPAPAPVQTIGNLWWSEQQWGNESTEHHRTVKQQLRGMLGTQVLPLHDIGPGCRRVSMPPQGSHVLTTLPLSIPAANPQSPQPVTVERTQPGTKVVHIVPSPTADYPEHATVIDDPKQGTVQFERASYADGYYGALGIQVVRQGMAGYAPGWGDAYVDTGVDALGAAGGKSVWFVLAAAAGAVALAGFVDRKKGRR